MLAMRDNDGNWQAHAIVRDDSTIRTLQDLEGRAIGFASSDPPQATILLTYFMQQRGFDLDVGPRSV
jgi:ABC-type phosphate/phosphonate transport system substrate-binding protein